MQEVKNISPEELKAALDAGKSIAILDVREDEELEISSLPGAYHIPLAELPERSNEWEIACNGKDLCVVICRSGQRSENAILFLEHLGISGAFNLAGGINAYAERIDSDMETY